MLPDPIHRDIVGLIVDVKIISTEHIPNDQNGFGGTSAGRDMGIIGDFPNLTVVQRHDHVAEGILAPTAQLGADLVDFPRPELGLLPPGVLRGAGRRIGGIGRGGPGARTRVAEGQGKTEQRQLARLRLDQLGLQLRRLGVIAGQPQLRIGLVGAGEQGRNVGANLGRQPDTDSALA